MLEIMRDKTSLSTLWDISSVTSWKFHKCRHSIIELAGQSSTAAANDKRRQKKIAHTSSSRGGRPGGARRTLAHPLFWKLVNKASLAPHFFEVQLCCAPTLFDTFCHLWVDVYSSVQRWHFLRSRDLTTLSTNKFWQICVNHFANAQKNSYTAMAKKYRPL